MAVQANAGSTDSATDVALVGSVAVGIAGGGWSFPACSLLHGGFCQVLLTSLQVEESMPGQNDMEDRVLPMHLAPPLHVTGGSKGTAGCYILAPEPSQDRCQNQVEYNTWNCLRVSDSGFSVWVYSQWP